MNSAPTSKARFARGLSSPFSAAPSPGTGYFEYHIAKFDLEGIARVPIFERRIDLKKVYFVKLKPGTTPSDAQVDKAAVIGYNFITAFPFPSCSIDVVDDTYQSRKWMPAKTLRVPAFVKTYKSNTVSFRYFVSESTATVEVEAGVTVHRTTVIIDLQVTPEKMDTTYLSISYDVGDVKLISVKPKPVRDLLIPGQINWGKTITESKVWRTQLSVVYES